MADARGNNKNIIVGAASMWVSTTGPFDYLNVDPALPDFVGGTSYADTLNAATDVVRNIGYTSNGIELTFTPDFGEVEVDQLLDAAKLYKQGMTVTLNTTFAEATLENLLVALALPESALQEDTLLDSPPLPEIPDLPGTKADVDFLELLSGDLGECPVERGLIAVGPGTGDCEIGSEIERIYLAYRALSIDAVTVSIKRDEATMYDVSFRLLPADNGSYGRIIDRAVPAPTVP
jgi:hypothetical protein